MVTVNTIVGLLNHRGAFVRGCAFNRHNAVILFGPVYAKLAGNVWRRAAVKFNQMSRHVGEDIKSSGRLPIFS